MRYIHGPEGPGFDEQFAARIDCEKNGCDPKHGDDGTILFRDEHLETVNGHAVTMLRRRVTYSEWEEVDRCPKCGHGWGNHQREIKLSDEVVHECDAYAGMGDWCGCKEEKPWLRGATT